MAHPRRQRESASASGLAGGISDKLGNRYEGRWTIACLASMLQDDWQYIDLEPYDGYKIEFTARRHDGLDEHHQAKRSAPRGGSWTRVKLEREGLLAAMDRWTESGHEFVLVSASPPDPDLANLATQARMGIDGQSFVASLSAERVAELRGLQKSLPGMSDDRAREMFSRIFFRQADEETLLDVAAARLALVMEGEPGQLVAHMSDYLDLHIGERITATAIWQFLAERGVRRRDWGADPDLRAAVEHQVTRFISDPTESAILGLQAPRREAVEVVDRLNADGGPQIVILSAAAGMGKSVVVRQAVEQLVTRRLTLPLRLDTLAPGGTADELGRQLGLRGSPVQVVGHLSAGEIAVLVIDQLDAVSEVSGRYGRGFDAVSEMLSELAAHPHVRLLLACRQFDLDVDRRLRGIRDREGSHVVEVSALDDDFVDRVLDAAAIVKESLSSRQREMLRVPLHLRLLAEAASARPTFATELDLFDAYWAAKLRSVGSRGGNEAAAATLIEEVAAEMSRRQELEVPDEVGGGRPVELRLLKSEHLLIPSDRRIRFFHERLFDYAFARTFARKDEGLSGFLTSTTQGLFRRSQARQILSYRRTADRSSYLRDLRETLLNPAIRVHLKVLVLAWLRTLPDPEEGEWETLADLLRVDDDRLIGHALSVLSGCPPMFDLADAAGLFHVWLDAQDETLRDRAALVLASIQRQRPSRVATLLGRLDCSDDRNRQRLFHAIRQADLAVDESFFAFFLGLTAAGCLDELRRVFATNDTFWELSHGLIEKQPDWAARFIRTYLDRRLQLASEDGVGDPFDDPDYIPHPLERDVFAKIAGAAPAAYVTEILPLVLSLIEKNKTWNPDELRFDDQIWRWRMFGDTYSVQEGLLTGLEEALRRLAGTAPMELASHRSALEAARSSTADHVLARAFAAAPGHFATDAAAWVTANPSRLEAGYTDASNWVGRELVVAIWAHIDAATRDALERVILGYYPAWERSREGRRAHGSAQYTILSGIPEDALTAAGRRRLAELRRKFGAEPSPPRGIEVGFVGSPVPAAATPKMTDVQWLNALREYASVDDQLGRRPTSLAGGALQLGRQLREEAKRDPDRFGRLGIGLSDELAVVYGEHILLGISETDDSSPELVFDLVRRLHALPGRPCGRYIGNAVAKVAAETVLPDDVIEMVAWYAVADPDPRSGNPMTGHERNDPVRLGLVDAGINTVRGANAHAIASILQVGLQELAAWRTVIASMTGDDSDAVRSCVARVLLVCLSRDTDWVVERAVELFDGRADVATSADAERLIHLAIRSHPDRVLPMISRLVASEDKAVARVGARLACVAAFLVEEGGSLAEQALTGNAGARYGAAEIYAANIAVDAYRAASRSALLALFDDPEPAVRREAGTCFRALRGKPLEGEEELLLTFASTAGITDDPDDVLRALIESPSLPPKAAIAVCKAVLAAAGVEASSIASAWSARMPEVATIAARLHAHPDEGVSAAGLDLIDTLAANGAYGLDRAIAAFER